MPFEREPGLGLDAVGGRPGGRARSHLTGHPDQVTDAGGRREMQVIVERSARGPGLKF